MLIIEESANVDLILVDMKEFVEVVLPTSSLKMDIVLLVQSIPNLIHEKINVFVAMGMNLLVEFVKISVQGQTKFFRWN